MLCYTKIIISNSNLEGILSIFFCDSNSELWYTKADELGINLISMPYTIDGQEYYYDLGRNTDFAEFFGKIRKGSVPKTSALNSYDYVQYFEPWLKQGEDILYITFSHRLSATFEQMYAALDELKTKYPDRKVTVFDSRHISLGAAIIVHKAATLHASGMADEDIVAKLEDLRKHIYCVFTVGDLVYLKRGGRLSNTKALLGTLLNIKPLIRMGADGTLVNFDKAKGRQRSLKALAGFIDQMGIDRSYPVGILNADCPDDAARLESLIKEQHGDDLTFWQQPVGPVIGTHCGPDTIGLVFYSLKEIE